MLDQYEIIKSLGEGGSGTVLQARQRLADRIVAIKVLSAAVVFDEASLKRFQREAKIAASLDHPNIAKIYSFGVSPEKGPYLVMEYLEGRTLAELLKERGKLSVETFINVFGHVCNAIEYAHTQGIIHRDIKPANIMIARRDDRDEIKVLDFGIAKRVDDQSKTSGLTQTGVAVGTPLYMSPEQCTGASCDQRSDIYSLGCVMYESICGAPPFTGETPSAVMLKQLNEAPPEFAKIDPDLKLPLTLTKLIYSCLNKDPALRPQSAAEVLAKIEEANSEAPMKVQSSGALSISVKIVGAVAFLIVLVILILSAVAISSKTIQARKIAERRKAIQKAWTQIDFLSEKANDLLEQKKYVDSRKSYGEVLQTIRKLPVAQQEIKRANEVRCSTFKGLAKVASGLGDSPQEYLNCMLQSIQFGKKAYGENNEAVLRATYDLAINLADSGTFLTEAESLANDLLKKRETNFKNLSKQLGGDEIALFEHHDQLCIVESRFGAAMSVLGYIKLRLGNNKEALALLQKSLDVEKEVSGYNDSTTLWTMYRLCLALDRCNLGAKEDAVLGQLLQQFEQGETEIPPGERHWILNQLITLFDKRKEYKRKKIVTEALAKMSENDYGSTAPETVRAKESLKQLQAE